MGPPGMAGAGCVPPAGGVARGSGPDPRRGAVCRAAQTGRINPHPVFSAASVGPVDAPP